MKWFLLLPAVLAATVLCSRDAPAQAPSDGGKLVRVVLLSRHGVRSPTQDTETLASWRRTATPAWPDFGVPPGYLTPKGEDLVDDMGGFYRTYLDPEGLFRADQCPDDVFIRADRDERTVLTAQGLGSGLTRGKATRRSGAVSRSTKRQTRPTRFFIRRRRFRPAVSTRIR